MKVLFKFYFNSREKYLHLLKADYLYFKEHFIFTSNETFFKNKYSPIIFIMIIKEV
jgi:hypothetical protein